MVMWYYTRDRKSRAGPVADAEMRELIASRQVEAADLVWREGLTNWIAVADVRELAAALPAEKPEPAPIPVSAIAPAPAPPSTPAALMPGVIEVVSKPMPSAASARRPEPISVSAPPAARNSIPVMTVPVSAVSPPADAGTGGGFGKGVVFVPSNPQTPPATAAALEDSGAARTADGPEPEQLPTARLAPPAPAPAAAPHLTALKELKELLDRGALTAEEFAEQKAVLLGQTATKPAADPAPRVVGCPKCQSKLRVKRPGVVECPKCQAKVRVAVDLFQRRPG